MHRLDLFKTDHPERGIHKKPIAITLATIVLGLSVITAIIFIWTGKRRSLIDRLTPHISARTRTHPSYTARGIEYGRLNPRRCQ